MSEVGLLNVNRYFPLFSIRRKEDIADSDYVWDAEPEDMARFGNLAGTILPDTPLEFALLSYYSPPIIRIRPVQADTILPANNPKLADLKLGAAVYQEIQVLRFLADTNAVGRYEGMLKFITDRGNVTRAEVEAFYRNGIRALISGIGDEEFNKVSFSLRKDNRIGYNAVLTRNAQNGQYVLSYGGIETNGEIRTITGNSPQALSHEMRNGPRKSDFSQLSIDTVSAQAALIPAVKLSDGAINEIKNILTSFYTNPNTQTYTAVMEVSRLYQIHEAANRNGLYDLIRNAYENTMNNLNPAIAQRIISESGRQSTVAVLTRNQQQRLIQLR